MLENVGKCWKNLKQTGHQPSLKYLRENEQSVVHQILSTAKQLVLVAVAWCYGPWLATPSFILEDLPGTGLPTADPQGIRLTDTAMSRALPWRLSLVARSQFIGKVTINKQWIL